jgi:hypothetical protein
MMQGGMPASLPARLELREKHAVRSPRGFEEPQGGAGSALTSFNGEQKKLANALMLDPMRKI